MLMTDTATAPSPQAREWEEQAVSTILSKCFAKSLVQAAAQAQAFLGTFSKVPLVGAVEADAGVDPTKGPTSAMTLRSILWMQFEDAKKRLPFADR
jgi:hypothetical protein